MMDDELVSIQIDKKEYLQLFRDSVVLNALKNAGIEAWEGYYVIDWEMVDKQVKDEEDKL